MKKNIKNMKQLSLRTALALSLGVIAMVSSTNIATAASSEWADLYGGKARLTAVKDPQTNKVSGMVEVQLKKGWKTYWKQPGDSGIPPSFDFSASSSFDLDSVQYPVPEIITNKSGYDLGYHNTVRFMFSGNTDSVDADLKLNFLAGICEEICIPATAELNVSSADLNQSDPKAAIALSLGKNYLPRQASKSFSLEGLAINGNKLTATPKLPKGLKNPVLLIEGPNHWFSGIINLHENENHFLYQLPIKLTENENWQNELHYTLIAQNRAIEGKLLIEPKN